MDGHGRRALPHPTPPRPSSRPTWAPLRGGGEVAPHDRRLPRVAGPLPALPAGGRGAAGPGPHPARSRHRLPRPVRRPQPRHPPPLLPRGALLLHLAARCRLHRQRPLPRPPQCPPAPQSRAAPGARGDRPPARLLRCPHGDGSARPRDPPHAAGHRRPLCGSGRPGPGRLRADGAAAARAEREGRQGPRRALRRPLRRRARRLSRGPRSRPGAALRRRAATRASTPASASGRTGSSNCCAGSAGPPTSRVSMPIASATPSPPGPSPTTPASSMSSTCSATALQTWCAATAPPTAAPRPPRATPPSRPARGCSSVRSARTLAAPTDPPSACVLPEATLQFPIWS